MTEKLISSPLGELSVSYLKKDSKHAGILLKPDEFTLEFYPKGYTQFSQRQGVKRQENLEKLWQLAVSIKREDTLFPFEGIPHTVELVPEPNNPKDPHALVVQLKAPFTGNKLEFADEFDLGYVPARICKNLKWKMFTGGRILKLRTNWHKKYYTAKVVLGYNNVFQGMSDYGDTSRFIDIAGEM